MGHGLVAGLDIGGTKIRGVLLDQGGTRLATARLSTGQGRDGVLASALECIEDLRAQVGTGAGLVSGIGIGIPGVVDPDDGAVSNAVNLGIGSESLRLAPELRERLGVATVRVENDVNVAAFGAAHALGIADAAYLSLGTGVAAGIVLDGTLQRGYLGVAGEIGHLPYDPNGPICACGQRGCLELYSSGSALTEAWRAEGGADVGTDLFAAAARGHRGAARIRATYLRAVSACVQTLILTCGVQTVLIGGGVADIGEPLLEGVREVLQARGADSGFIAGLAMPERVALADGANDAAAIGAAVLATESAHDEVREVLV